MTDKKNVCKALASVASANEALAVAFWKEDEWQLGRGIKSIRDAADALGFDLIEREQPAAPAYVADTAALNAHTVGEG